MFFCFREEGPWLYHYQDESLVDVVASIEESWQELQSNANLMALLSKLKTTQ